MKFEIASILNRCTTELSLNKDINLAINNILQIVNEYFYERTFYTMNRKLLFFDIDGTLLAGGIPGYIPDSTIEALKHRQMGTISLSTVGVHMDLCQKPLKNSLLTAMFVAAVRKLFSTVRLFITMILMKI